MRANAFDGFRAIRRTNDNGQVVLVKDLEGIGKDSKRAIAVILNLASAAADCHRIPCSLSI